MDKGASLCGGRALSKSKALIIVCCIFLCFLTGCDAVYRFLDEKGAEEKEILGEVMPYERNTTVLEVQQLLDIYGYNPGKPDGVLGDQTRRAIERFQTDNGLETTRVIDQSTWEELTLYRRYGLVKDGELNISLIQEILKVGGFYHGEIDGKLGPNTLQAVKDFQEITGLKVDGKIGFQTLKEMSRYLAFE